MMASFSAGQRFFMVLAFLLLVCEVLFAAAVLQTGDGDVVGGAMKSLLLFLFVYFSYLGFTWAKWVVTVLLFFFSLACLLGGFEQGSLALKIVGMYYLYFLAMLHFSQSVKAHFQSTRAGRQSMITMAAELPVNHFQVNEALFEYPSLRRRYGALLLDFLVVVALLAVVYNLTAGWEQGALITRIVAGILLLSYEPFLTSYSRTVGQTLMGVRVRRVKNPAWKINLLQAFLRVLVKGLLGWVSFLTMRLNPEHRAIHDLASGSVVIREPLKSQMAQVK